MQAACVALALLAAIAVVRADYDYRDALFKSVLFYQAQRSGKLYGMHELVSYRKDSALNDRGNNGEDLTGGYYDAGDLVKFGFPMAYTITTLAWGVHDYEDGYSNSGTLEEAQAAIRWGTDYFLKAHVSDYEFYGQVGNGDIDHTYWSRPEDSTESRPAYKIDVNNPGSDLAAETAAAFAAASMVFSKAGDTDYANTLLSHAKTLYKFADSYRGKYSDSITDANKFYSSHDFSDELVWGAIWIYRATYDTTYLNKAVSYYSDYGMNVRNGFSWNDKSLGATVLLAKNSQDSQYKSHLQTFCDNLLSKQQRTPKGLVFVNEWGSLRYAANLAFICMQAADLGINAASYRAFAKQQIDYMLGSTGHSFVVGFGNNPPTHAHHRAGSCPNEPAVCNWDTYYKNQSNPQIVYGALVGGPDANDGYTDIRTDAQHNEVACDYNAAFVGVLAALRTLGY